MKTFKDSQKFWNKARNKCKKPWAAEKTLCLLKYVAERSSSESFIKNINLLSFKKALTDLELAECLTDSTSTYSLSERQSWGWDTGKATISEVSEDQQTIHPS